jgi:hypothetical protein
MYLSDVGDEVLLDVESQLGSIVGRPANALEQVMLKTSYCIFIQ